MKTTTDSEHAPGRPRVLVVEDDEDLRLTLHDWLALKGYAVWEAHDGLEALDVASKHDLDVVVTDLKMPRCDGLHLLQAIKSRTPLVQVIFLTGEASIGDAIEALREGRSFDFLQKPLHDLRQLGEVIDRALAHRARQMSAAPPREAPPCPAPSPASVAIADEPALVLAVNYIAAHFREPIGLREVAAATGYSPSYLTNLMRQKTGKTVQQWILTHKLTEAQRLLSTTDWPVQRIASEVGYAAANYFNRQFRQVVGMSPQTWRNAGEEADPA